MKVDANLKSSKEDFLPQKKSSTFSSDANLKSSKEKKTQTDYNKKFMEKQKDKKYNCDICGRDYSYYAKSKHLKTSYHKFAKDLKDKLQPNNQ